MKNIEKRKRKKEKQKERLDNYLTEKQTETKKKDRCVVLELLPTHFDNTLVHTDKIRRKHERVPRARRVLQLELCHAPYS